MSKAVKTRTPMSARSKGWICLAVLLALTVFVSIISIAGMNLDAEGVNILLPWVPVQSARWPQSLPLNRALNGGSYYEYTAALPEGSEGDLAAETQNAVQVIQRRINGMSENDGAVSLRDGTVRLEMGQMDAERTAGIVEWLLKSAQFEFVSGEDVILTEKDIEKAELALNKARNGYNLVITANKEGEEKLAASGTSYLNITCDGESVASYATVNGASISAAMGSTQSGYVNGSNLAFLLNTGALDVKLTRTASGEIDASAASVKTIVLIVAAVLLVCALCYLLMTGKLTGLAGFLTVWCAVLLSLFFVATIVVPTASVISLSVGCLVAVLLGMLLAIYTAVVRTDAIAAQIREGSTPRQAAKFGFRAAARQVWIAHGAVLLIALLLMIFAATQPIGYTLAAGVAGSAITACLMRAFLACFISISGKTALYGKAQ